MRLRTHYLWPAAVLSVAAAILPAVAGSTSPAIEAVNTPGGGLYGEETHAWSPPTAIVSAGGAVTLSNNTPIEHGVHWINPPEAPVCSGIPVGTTSAIKGANWSGTCTFAKPGTYTFYCTVHGPEMTGTITVKSVGEPVALTEGATLVGEHQATLHGTVNPEGKATTYHFNYGTSTTYGKETPEESAESGTANKTVSELVSGLSAGTPYHYQLVAKNGLGTARGSDRIFTTASAPGPPVATTEAATAVSETKATLKGIVNPDGRPTKYLFEWGTDASYGQVTAEVPVGEDHTGHVASATLPELAPGTVYHFRLVAKNTSAETVPGVDQTFTTVSPPHSPSPSPPPPPTGTTPTPVVGPLPTEPFVEPPSGPSILGSPSLRTGAHGASVRGSLDVSQSGAGGRLEVDLLAKSASLAAAHRSGSVRVGRLVRSSLSAGKLSFSVPLTARGERGLRQHHHLSLTVKITLTPVRGATTTVTRTLTLRS